jgi:hypothetical protein
MPKLPKPRSPQCRCWPGVEHGLQCRGPGSRWIGVARGQGRLSAPRAPCFPAPGMAPSSRKRPTSEMLKRSRGEPAARRAFLGDWRPWKVVVRRQREVERPRGRSLSSRDTRLSCVGLTSPTRAGRSCRMPMATRPVHHTVRSCNCSSPGASPDGPSAGSVIRGPNGSRQACVRLGTISFASGWHHGDAQRRRIRFRTRNRAWCVEGRLRQGRPPEANRPG